MFQSHL